MKKLFVNKLKESVLSVLPIVLIVIALLLILGFDFCFIFQFAFSSIFVILGLTIFTVGADISMVEIGQKIGEFLAKKNLLIFTLFCSFVLGVVITVAEPDLTVLATQVSNSINSTLLILSISIGVGVYLIISTLRTRFNIPLNIILIVSYLLVFIIAFFLPENFYPLGLDCGSVTTGPISVPFIMAFGLGLSAIISKNGKSGDSGFGAVGLVSVGPILSVMIVGLILNPTNMTYSFDVAQSQISVLSVITGFFASLPEEMLNVVIIILPIFIFFLLFQIFALKLPKNNIKQIMFGLFYVFLGISLFLCAVEFGFLCTGQQIGLKLAELDNNWIVIPFFALIGLVIALAEPAVHVLARQIETVTGGVITKKYMFLSICIGVCLALTLVAIRILTSINILFVLIPLATISFILTFIVPKIFTGIAFDSGGVVTGAMSTTFVLPMIIGVVSVVGGNGGILTTAFGSLAIIAFAPILCVLVVGLIYKFNTRKQTFRVKSRKAIIVDFE